MATTFHKETLACSRSRIGSLRRSVVSDSSVRFATGSQHRSRGHARSTALHRRFRREGESCRASLVLLVTRLCTVSRSRRLRLARWATLRGWRERTVSLVFWSYWSRSRARTLGRVMTKTWSNKGAANGLSAVRSSVAGIRERTVRSTAAAEAVAELGR